MSDDLKTPARPFPVRTAIVFCLVAAGVLAVFGMQRHVGTATESGTSGTSGTSGKSGDEKVEVSVEPNGNGGVFPRGYAKGGDGKK